MFFCYCLVIFVVNIFFFTFISGFFGAPKNWRIWCCFEESIAVEERDLVGTSWGSNGKWYVFLQILYPLYIRRICAEIRPKMVEIYIIWFPHDSTSPCFCHWWILRRGEISWLMKSCSLRCSFSFKVQRAELFSKTNGRMLWSSQKSIRLGEFFGFLNDSMLPPST